MTPRRWNDYLPWVTTFAVAMGFLEAAVVVYLRAIAYPGGFRFPLVSMDSGLVVTELVREVATMVMLLTPGALISVKRMERFAWFCWAFAVWDLFYYVFLKLLLSWPDSLFTWDLLFLLPTVWVAPVWAPCIISLGLLALAALLLERRAKDPEFRMAKWQWFFLILAALVYFTSFIEGPIRWLRSVPRRGTYVINDIATLSDYSPSNYQWIWFLMASMLALWAILPLARSGSRMRK